MSLYPYAAGSAPTDTSEEAAAHIQPVAATLRALTRQAYAAAGSEGLTADECAAVLGYSILSIRPRVTELGRLGEIEDSGNRRKNGSGRSAIVWQLKIKEDLFS